jgi:hypothetical protein
MDVEITVSAEAKELALKISKICVGHKLIDTMTALATVLSNDLLATAQENPEASPHRQLQEFNRIVSGICIAMLSPSAGAIQPADRPN